MDIQGYKYIQHRFINFPDAPECQFTVELPDGRYVDQSIRVPALDMAEEDLAQLIQDCVVRTEQVLTTLGADQPKSEIEDAVQRKEDEMLAVLVKKGLLIKGQSIEDIQSKAEIVSDALVDPVEEVKP